LESHNTGYAQKSVVNKLQLPLKPKKPSPPFFQYLQEKKQEVIEKHNLNFKGKYFILLFYPGSIFPKQLFVTLIFKTY